MGVLARRYMIMHLFIIHFFSCLGWLCNIALAQLEISESVTGSANFPDIGIAFVANLAIFIASLLRGRLDLEMGARDILATMRGPQLYEINKGFGLTTCEPNPDDRFRRASVVMLSYNTANSSIRQFMKYICNAYKVHSILLQCFPLQSNKSVELLPGLCKCAHDDSESKCKCIVFWNVQEIIMVLARRMPGTLKRLSDSLCLLPCPQCLITGCHGCKEGQNVEETEEYGRKKLTESETEKGKKAVEEIFNYISENSMKEDHPCICIPLSPSGYDYWTKLLIRSFGATGDTDRVYSTASLIVPRLTEISLNFVLTAWFRVDGFSSSVVARRAIKDYVVDSKGSGFSAGAFLVKVMKKNSSNADCRVLDFRGRLGIRTFSYIVGSVNLICSIGWAMLVALQGSRFGKWYDKHSMPLNKPRVVVIMIAIGFALCLDCMHLYLTRSRDSKEDRSSKEPAVNVESREERSSDSREPTSDGWCRRVWDRLKVWFRPIVQVSPVWLRRVWDRLKLWFRPIVQVLFLGGLNVLKVWFLRGLKDQKVLVLVVIYLEMACILSGSIVLGVLGSKCFGRWLYSSLQVLVWIKWGVGSYLLGEYPPEYDSQYEYDNGILVYSSAFLLNSILAGVRGDWEYSLSFKNLN